MKSFARFISYLFHPLVFILHVPFLIIYHTTGDAVSALKWVLFSSCFLLIVMAIFYLLHPEEFMTDFDISKKETRIVFYTIAIVLSLIYFIIAVIFKGIFSPLTIVSLGVIVGLLILEIANVFIKVSIHVSVISAYTITIGALYGTNALLIVVWLVPLVAWARITLKKHTYQEVIAGAMLGGIVTAITMAVGKLLL